MGLHPRQHLLAGHLPPGQEAFLGGPAPTLQASEPDSLWLAGDFNFVPEPRLDRTPLPGGAESSQARATEMTAAALNPGPCGTPTESFPAPAHYRQRLHLRQASVCCRPRPLLHAWCSSAAPWGQPSLTTSLSSSACAQPPHPRAEARACARCTTVYCSTLLLLRPSVPWSTLLPGPAGPMQAAYLRLARQVDGGQGCQQAAVAACSAGCGQSHAGAVGRRPCRGAVSPAGCC